MAVKALVLNTVRQPLVYEDRPEPVPKQSEVVVRLRAAALNRRDYWIRQGQYPGIKTPVVLGSDGAGVVASVGENVSADWLGREVVLNPGMDWGSEEASQSGRFHILGMPRDGTLAAQVVIPEVQLHDKPRHLNWEQAAALPLAAVTAYRAVFVQGRLSPDESVLITGIGGGVAVCALQFCVAFGARVWVTSSSPAKLERAKTLGAEGGINYTSSAWDKELQRLMDPPSLIIDGAGGNGYATLLELAAPGGRVVNYGATAGAPGKLDLFKVFWKQLCLQGSTMGSPSDFQTMLEYVNKHSIQPVVDAVFPLSEGNEALDGMARSPQFGKYVVKPEETE